jgi:hypothetical protein
LGEGDTVLLAAVMMFAGMGLAVFSLIDCALASGRAARLPAWAWVVLILVVPFAGPIAWLIAGRPDRPQHGRHPRDWWGEEPLAEPRGPEDDPAFWERLRREQN